MGKIEIQVKHLSESTFKLQVEENATVGELKQAIEKERNLPASELKLICKGKILKNDSDTLQDLKIENGASLHMVHTKPQEAPQ